MGTTGKVFLAGTSLLALAVGMAYSHPVLADTTISQATGAQSWTSGNFTVTNGGIITGTRPINGSGSLGTLTIGGGGSISGSRTGVYNTGAIAALINSGTIIGTLGGIDNLGTITILTNSATISGGNTGLANRGSIATLTNSGTIAAVAYFGIGNASAGIIGTLVNSGTISSGTRDAVRNDGSIAVLTNSGTISSSGGYAVANYSGGSIGTLVNSAIISGGLSGLYNVGTIATLINTGTISASHSGLGINNGVGGSIGMLTNSGTIRGGVTTGLGNSGSVGTLSNQGLITDVKWGILNTSGATFRVLDNAAGGTIHGDSTGILNSGSLGTVTNAGTISGANFAISTSGSLGPLSNSGVVAGNIQNSSSNPLTIAGGSGGTYGLLTGYNAGSPSLSSPGTVGTITSTSADLLFSSGNLLLNDSINVGTHTVGNSGVTFQIVNPVTITGTYSQSGGGLVIVTTSRGSSYGYLTVSGNATVANSTVTISGSGLAAGESFTIVRSGATGSYSGDTATVSGTSGLSARISESGNDLVVTLVGSHYGPLGAAAGGAATGMGQALDAISAASGPAATAFQNTVLPILDALPAASQAAAVKQLAPTQMAPALQVANLAVAPVTSAIEQHELALSGDGGVGVAGGSGGREGALWGRVLGNQSQRETTAGADGYRSHGVGLAFGLDRQVTRDLMAGAALSWLRGWSTGLDGSSGSSVRSDNYQLTAYGLQRWEQAFVDGQAGLGYSRFNQKRAVGFLGAAARADYGGEFYLAKLGVGYDLPAGNVTVTPLAGLRFLRVVSDAYGESGAGNADLSVNRRGVQSLTQDFGGKVAWSMDTGWGLVKPELRLAWVHDYTQGPIAASGLIGGEAFTSTIARPSADGARINLAATLERSDELSLRAEYEGEIRPNYWSQTGAVKLIWAF
ncbi:autotransporter outer membrane beta-barrel domain-containing protein [Telmatospirillum siberiense]|nr:autotransporter domain-containing protein [Telmatospirillum siberiense]